MLKGIDTNERKSYVSKSDVGENPTVFFIGNLTHRDKISLFADAMTAEGNADITKLQGKSIDILLASLKEIKNLNGFDYAGKDIEKAINMIPFDVVMELVGVVLNYNFMSGQEAKN